MGELLHRVQNNCLHVRSEKTGVAAEILTPHPERNADRLVPAFPDNLGSRQIAETVVVKAGHPQLVRSQHLAEQRDVIRHRLGRKCDERQRLAELPDGNRRRIAVEQ